MTQRHFEELFFSLSTLTMAILFAKENLNLFSYEKISVGGLSKNFKKYSLSIAFS